MDQRTDMPSYRDAKAASKKALNINLNTDGFNCHVKSSLENFSGFSIKLCRILYDKV